MAAQPKNFIMNNQETKEADRLIPWLLSVKNDRGTMAELRCLLNPNLRHRGWQAISRIGGLGNTAYELVAGLFAMHPMHDSGLANFGTSCRWLAARNNRGAQDSSAPLDTRFRRLLDADRSELAELLPTLVRHLKSESIPVNYDTLLQDLRFWSEPVLTRWAQEYWNPRNAPRSCPCI